jgi:hypothetical protein
MAIKIRSRKNRKTPKRNKRKLFSSRVKTSKYRRKQRRQRKRKTYKIRNQSGGMTTSNLLNAARYIPHTLTNTYNGLVGNAASASFLPWAGHY